MLSNILKDPKFRMLFSLLIGVGIVIILLRPVCKGKECVIEKAPSIKDVKGKIFNVMDKCYTFEYESVQCPSNTVDIIEPFDESEVDNMQPTVMAYKGEFIHRE
jgi:hypothetical protein